MAPRLAMRKLGFPLELRSQTTLAAPDANPCRIPIDSGLLIFTGHDSLPPILPNYSLVMRNNFSSLQTRGQRSSKSQAGSHDEETVRRRKPPKRRKRTADVIKQQFWGVTNPWRGSLQLCASSANRIGRNRALCKSPIMFSQNEVVIWVHLLISCTWHGIPQIIWYSNHV